MKTVTLISLLVTSSKLFGAEPVKPLVGDQFGQVLTLEVEFVDKSDSYFDQNIVKARWNAKVFKINGKILDSPIVFEYRAEEDNFREGVRYQLQGYEDVYSGGKPKGWESMTQINYDIHHYLHLRIPPVPAGQTAAPDMEAAKKSYSDISDAKERMEFCIELISSGKIKRTMKIDEIAAIFGKDIRIPDHYSDGMKYCFVDFSKQIEGNDPFSGSDFIGWYLCLEIEKNGKLQKYWLSNLHK